MTESQSNDNIKFQIIEEDQEIIKPLNTTSIETVQINFDEKIQKFIRENRPVLYILTPCFNGMCYINYVNSLMYTIEVFKKLGLELKIEFCKNDSLVSRARNNLIARAMTNKSATHFLFIDNDIAWDPIDILKLLISDKPIIGGIYPLKNYDWGKLIKDPQNPYNSNIVQSLLQKKNGSLLHNMITDEAMIQHNLLRYNINYMNNSIVIEDNLIKVRHLATGFMMIRRDTIEKMIIAFPSTKYVDDVQFLKPEENAMAYALFDCGVEDGHYFSEDWLFCQRWSKMGGDIYADISINLTHTGIEDYRGSYLSSII